MVIEAKNKMEQINLQTTVSNSHSEKVTKILDQLFPEQEYEEKQIKRTKEILGGKAQVLTNDQLRDITSEVQYLVSIWLDDFERQTFKGLTLKELLHEKGQT